jgi:hypothetical protein
MTLIESIQWIDVKEALPDDDRMVLVLVPSNIFPVSFAYFDAKKGNTWFWSGAWSVQRSVTHWAECPKGPTGGAA